MISEHQLVHTGSVIAGSRLPLLVTPATDGCDLVEWLRAHCREVDGWLADYGGLLFRGFGIDEPARFHAVVAACSRELMGCQEGSSPRTVVREHVYTSTDCPPDPEIFPHNEHSYASRFPLKIAFCCMTQPDSGGETPIADCRRVLARIPAEIRDLFRAREGWMYVRNLSEGLGPTWQAVYQTEDRSAVERYCRANEINYEWCGETRLRTLQVRPVTVRHPITREEVWFNHATFFNVGTLPELLRTMVREQFALEDLPNNTYFGDGSVIDDDTLAVLQEAYQREQVSFPWMRGDVLLLDNVLTAHGRRSFAGPRKVLVSMADPIDRAALTVQP